MGLSALSVVLLVLRRLHAKHADERRAATAAVFRPIVLAIVSGDEVPFAQRLRTYTQPVLFADVLIGYAQRLRGPARERVAAFFERHGDVEREQASLGRRNAQRRAIAAHRLGDMGSPSCIPALIALLEEDADRDVRSACARSLGCLQATNAVRPLVEALVGRRVPHARAAQALLAIGPSAIPELLSLLSADEPEVRAWAVELVGLLGDASHGDELIHSLRDTSAEVRVRSARALGRLGAAVAAEELRGALGDRVPAVRGAAASALGRLRDPLAFDPLLELARSDLFEPARDAADALARIDPDRLRVEAEFASAGEHVREAASRPSA
jgi:hypothetical protein